MEGNPVYLTDLLDRRLVLEFGSLTCPIFQGRRAAMRALSERYPNNRFIVFYVREAHPGETTPHHASQQKKLQNACLLRHRHGEERDVFVDFLDGKVHRLLGEMPNSVFVIDTDRALKFYSEWNDVVALDHALKALNFDLDVPQMKRYFRPIEFSVFRQTLKLAGKGAMRGFYRCWRSAFDLLILKNIRVFLRE